MEIISTDGPSSWSSRWRRLHARIGMLATLLFALGHALAEDLWLRCWILPRTKRRPAVRRRAVNRLVRRWGVVSLAAARTFLRLDIRVEGDPPRQGRWLVLANHQSSLDIPLLIDTLGDLDLKFVALDRFERGKPGVSLALREGGFCFVAKEDVGEDLAALRRFAAGLADHEGSACIFPEGGRSTDGSLGPFHMAGCETVRRTAGLPVVVVTLDGLWPGPSLFQYHRLHGARVTVRIGERIPAEAFAEDPRSVYERIEEKMRRDLDELRTEAGLEG